MVILISIQQPVQAWQIPPEGVATLQQRFPNIAWIHATDPAMREEGLAQCDVAFTWILSAAEVELAPRLRWVHTSAVAVETLALPELFARGVIVSNSRGVQAVPIAEHVFAVLLALARRLPLAFERQQERRWSQNEFGGEKLPWLLSGRTLGLLGVGTIGGAIASRAAAFGMNVIALRRRADGPPVPGVQRILTPGDLDALLGESDVLIIAAPLTPETTQLIGAAQLARMKPGSVLINVGRARIIDHVALGEAVRTGHLGGAALDVYHQEPLPPEDPLWTLPNMILTPHTSGYRKGHWEEVVDLFSENLRLFLKGEPVRFRVQPELGY